MNPESLPEWYLDIEGTRSGPYTTHQIEGFLSDGEILPRHRVISSRRPGQSVSAGDFVAALHHHYQENPGNAVFQPPPRPQDIHEKGAAFQVDTTLNDPAHALFDALQVARERKTQNKLNVPHAKEWGMLSRREKRIPTQLWLIAALGSVLWISVWGVLRVLDKPLATTDHSSPAVALTSTSLTGQANSSHAIKTTQIPDVKEPRPVEVHKALFTLDSTAMRVEKPRTNEPTLARPAARTDGLPFFGRNLPAPASAAATTPIPPNPHSGNTSQLTGAGREPQVVDGNSDETRGGDAAASENRNNEDGGEHKPVGTLEGGERVDPREPRQDVDGNQPTPID